MTGYTLYKMNRQFYFILNSHVDIISIDQQIMSFVIKSPVLTKIATLAPDTPDIVPDNEGTGCHKDQYNAPPNNSDKEENIVANKEKTQQHHDEGKRGGDRAEEHDEQRGRCQTIFLIVERDVEKEAT